jgi:hypothetical protein
VEQLLIAGAVALAVAAVALVLRRRAVPVSPTRTRRGGVPTQLDRNDFDRPGAPWLVVVFSSDTCLSCADTRAKAAELASAEVAVQDVEVTARPDLHRRYEVDSVPMVVIADADGAVRASFVGPPRAADLWSTLARLRSAPPDPMLGR